MTMGMCFITLPPPPDFNGHDYVDLGLPSGTLWATMNVGASKPSDVGFYFQWGDTVGYTKEQVGTDEGKKKFASDWSDYKWGVNPNFTKYTAPSAKLELEDDAAHVHMGGDWHMPTPDQIRELIYNTTYKSAAQNGVNGNLVSSKKDASKSIFIPAAGKAWDGTVINSGSRSCTWSSMLNTGNVKEVETLDLDMWIISYSSDYRFCGLSVRGVIG